MLAITGANGQIGRRLIRRLAEQESELPVRALVRSAAAAASLRGQGATHPRLEILTVDFSDAEAMGAALSGVTRVVHLVGILRETPGNRYVDAHEGAVAALVAAARRNGVAQVIALSILGAAADQSNACLKSRGRADDLLLRSGVPGTVLRVPMVLGGEDPASRALAARARRPWSVTFRGASLEQPIDADDVVAALRALIGMPAADLARAGGALDLAGPESLTREALVNRAVALTGRRTRVLSLPIALGHALAFVLERAFKSPPVTRAMLGVLDHDDRIDPAPVAARLGIELTPLDVTLRRVMALP
jgi:NADH dehydrogenase